MFAVAVGTEVIGYIIKKLNTENGNPSVKLVTWLTAIGRRVSFTGN